MHLPCFISYKLVIYFTNNNVNIGTWYDKKKRNTVNSVQLF